MDTKDLIAQSKEFDEHKADLFAQAKDVAFFGDDEKLYLNVEERSLFNDAWTKLDVEDHALGQLCDKLGPPPRDYIRKCPGFLAAKNLNYWSETLEKDWMIRTHGNVARAVVSGLYAPVSNTFILETLDEFLGGEARPTIGFSKVTRDELFARVAFGAKEIDVPGFSDTDHYAVGIYFGNSEIGTSAVKVLPFVMRSSCTNSTIWADEEVGVVQKHYGFKTKQFIKAIIKEKLGNILGKTEEMLERIVAAEVEEIPDPLPLIDRFLNDNGFTDVRDYVLVGMEGRPTRAGVHHGLTYAATQIENDARAERLQMLAGSYLFGQRLTVSESDG